MNAQKSENNPKRQHDYRCHCRNGKHGSQPCSLAATDMLLDPDYLRARIGALVSEPQAMSMMTSFTTAQR